MGCHTGGLSQILHRENNCSVTGIEINSHALSFASPYLQKQFSIDLNDLDSWRNVGDKKYDFVTWIHVLEHLVNPLDALKQSVQLINNEGSVIIALPNISNARERFDMVFGKFEYTETGVMDNTHLKFYNYHTAIKLIQDAGLHVKEYYSAWQTNPTRQFLNHLPVLHHLGSMMNENKPPAFPRYTPNLTDVTMMFKCKVH